MEHLCLALVNSERHDYLGSGRIEDRMVEVVREGAHGRGRGAHREIGVLRRRRRREGRAPALGCADRREGRRARAG